MALGPAGIPIQGPAVDDFAYEVDCTDIADVIEDNGRSKFGLAMADLTCAWENLVGCRIEPPSWLLARRLMEKGLVGIVVPSFAPGAGPATAMAAATGAVA